MLNALSPVLFVPVYVQRQRLYVPVSPSSWIGYYCYVQTGRIDTQNGCNAGRGEKLQAMMNRLLNSCSHRKMHTVCNRVASVIDYLPMVILHTAFYLRRTLNYIRVIVTARPPLHGVERTFPVYIASVSTP